MTRKYALDYLHAGGNLGIKPIDTPLEVNPKASFA